MKTIWYQLLYALNITFVRIIIIQWNWPKILYIFRNMSYQSFLARLWVINGIRSKVLPGLSTFGILGVFCSVAAWIFPSDAIGFSESRKIDRVIELNRKLFLRFEEYGILLKRPQSFMVNSETCIRKKSSFLSVITLNYSYGLNNTSQN